MSRDAQTLGVESRYEVLETIGQGAAAIVHKVRDRRDGAVKAAKLLRPEQVKNQQVVHRFEDEFRILRDLHHPGLPEVYDYGWAHDESRYIVMEFVDGQPLDQFLLQNPGDLWVILYELCEVLSFIHSHNLLHQDIKPGNILVKRTAAFGDEMPLAVLIDFGLTFRRDANQDVAMVGTPAYMAPEIIRGDEPLTRAVDYYSLGVTLYQLIVGHLPFQGSAREILDGHLNRDIRFDREKIEYAELYPHVRGLMAKDKQARLSAFEDFRRSVIGRMTGGVEEMEQAYGLAHVNSLGMMGKDEVWKELMEWVGAAVDRPGEGGSGGSGTGPQPVDDLGEVDVDFAADVAALPSVGETPATDAASSVPASLIASISGAPGSGKSYLIRKVAGELSIRGVTTLNIERALNGARSASVSEANRYMDAWTEIRRVAEPRGVVVTVDDVDELDEDVREFLVYLLRRHNITKASGGESRLRFLMTAAVTRGEEAYEEATRIGEQPIDLRLRPLQPDDHQRVLGEFRTRILERREAKNLGQFMSRVGHNPANISDGLRAALIDGAARFQGGRWRFQLAEHGTAAESHEYYGKLAEHLGGTERQTLFATACHRGPIDVSVLCHSLQLDPQDVQRRAQRLCELGLLRFTDGARRLSFPSDALRERVYQIIPSSTRNEIHRQLSRHVDEALQNTALQRHELATLAEQQSFHLEVLGDYREALRCVLFALNRWTQEGDVFGVRRVSRRCVELCSAHDSSLSSTGSTWLFKRYAVRALLNLEWRQSNLHRVRDIVEREYVSKGDDVPLSFVPKYARALQAVGFLAEARELLHDGLEKIDKPISIPSLQMRIELSLVLQQASEVKESLRILDGVSDHLSRLDDYCKCRFYLHCALCYETMVLHDKVLVTVRAAERLARENGFAYETTIVHQIRANVRLDRQELSKAMSQIAVGVRFAGRHGQYRSRGSLYFRASAAYFIMGDYARCLSYLSKALTIAERLGDAHNAVVYFTRFGMIYQGMGQYGNALRFLDRADSAMKTVMSRDDRAKLGLVRLDIGLDLNLGGLDALLADLGILAVDQMGKYEEGYYHLLSARYHEREGDYENARVSFETARETHLAAGIVDDTVIASAMLALLHLRTGENQRFASLLACLDDEISNVESENVWALYNCVRLEEALHNKERSTESLTLAERCERQRTKVTEAPMQLMVDQRLYMVWVRLGKHEEARRAFTRFHQTVKRVVANLPSRSLANQFLSRPDIAQTLSEYRAWQERQKNARS